MLFHWLPITPSSGSGIQAGQKTGAWMRSARCCHPTSAFAGHRSLAAAFTESLPPPPQPASAKAASARAPSRFTAPLKPVNRDPGPCPPVAGLQVVDELRPGAEGVVEPGFARIVRPRRENAIGDRPRHDHVADPRAAKPGEVPIRVERTLRARQLQMQHVE